MRHTSVWRDLHLADHDFVALLDRVSSEQSGVSCAPLPAEAPLPEAYLHRLLSDLASRSTKDNAAYLSEVKFASVFGVNLGYVTARLLAREQGADVRLYCTHAGPEGPEGPRTRRRPRAFNDNRVIFYIDDLDADVLQLMSVFISGSLQCDASSVTVMQLTLIQVDHSSGHATTLFINGPRQEFYVYDPNGSAESYKLLVMLAALIQGLHAQGFSLWQGAERYSPRCARSDGSGDGLIRQELLDKEYYFGSATGVCLFLAFFVPYLMMLFGYEYPQQVLEALTKMKTSLVARALNGFTQTLLLRATQFDPYPVIE